MSEKKQVPKSSLPRAPEESDDEPTLRELFDLGTQAPLRHAPDISHAERFWKIFKRSIAEPTP